MGPEQPGEPLRPHLLTSLGGWSNHELKVSGEAQAEHRSDEQWINGFKKKKKHMESPNDWPIPHPTAPSCILHLQAIIRIGRYIYIYMSKQNTVFLGYLCFVRFHLFLNSTPGNCLLGDLFIYGVQTWAA